MKVKNIMFSGFAAAILMGVGAANAVVSTDAYNLANTGYVDAKVAAAKKHFDDKYDSEKTLTTLLGEKEDSANKVAELDLKSADGSVDLAKLGALDAQKTTYPSVSAAKAIADAVLSSVDKVSAQVGDLGTTVASLKTTVGDADSGLVKAVAENTSAIETLNGNGDGSVAKALSDAKEYANGLAVNYDAAGAADDALADAKTYTDEQIVALDLANKYEEKGEAAKALTDANAYTDAEIAKVDAKGYVTAQGAKDAVATEGYLKSADLTPYAKTADLKADTMGETGKFIVTVSETNGIVSATAESFAEAVTAEGTVAPQAKAVKQYVDNAITGLGIDNYATKDEVAKKLQLTEGLSAGTYMVTVGEGGVVTYTAVTVATAADVK